MLPLQCCASVKNNHLLRTIAFLIRKQKKKLKFFVMKNFNWKINTRLSCFVFLTFVQQKPPKPLTKKRPFPNWLLLVKNSFENFMKIQKSSNFHLRTIQPKMLEMRGEIFNAIGIPLGNFLTFRYSWGGCFVFPKYMKLLLHSPMDIAANTNQIVWRRVLPARPFSWKKKKMFSYKTARSDQSALLGSS